MPIDEFFEVYFPGDFWAPLKRQNFPTDDHSMFADEYILGLLIKRFRPSTIIEIGSWKGHSANFMADVCKRENLKARILCVDTFLGSVEHWHHPESRAQLFRELGRPTILERFLGNTIARGNDDVIFPLALDSNNASSLLKVWNFRADMIFVDAAHDPESVTSDLDRYLPLLSNHGVMFGDDYQHEPLANAVHSFAARHNFQVLVSSRKWVFVTPGVIESILGPEFAARSSRDGWVHP